MVVLKAPNPGIKDSGGVRFTAAHTDQGVNDQICDF